MMSLIIYGLIAAAAFGMARLSQRIARSSESATPGPWCAACGYSLHGVDVRGRCPECGVDLRANVPKFQPLSPLWRRWLAVAVWTVAVVMLALCFERAVMLKYEPRVRHLMFLMSGQAGSSPRIQAFTFDALELSDDWFIGPGFDFDRDLPFFAWRFYRPYRFNLRNNHQVIGPPERAYWDRATRRLSYLDMNGDRVAVPGDGLTVEAFEQWAKANSIDLSNPVTHAELVEVVQLLRMHIDGEGPYDRDRKYLSLGIHVPVGSGRCYTPWYLLVPFLLIVFWYWCRGVARIWTSSDLR